MPTLEKQIPTTPCATTPIHKPIDINNNYKVNNWNKKVTPARGINVEMCFKEGRNGNRGVEFSHYFKYAWFFKMTFFEKKNPTYRLLSFMYIVQWKLYYESKHYSLKCGRSSREQYSSTSTWSNIAIILVVAVKSKKKKYNHGTYQGPIIQYIVQANPLNVILRSSNLGRCRQR